jgi:hypothetical protein
LVRNPELLGLGNDRRNLSPQRFGTERGAAPRPMLPEQFHNPVDVPIAGESAENVQLLLTNGEHGGLSGIPSWQAGVAV